MEHTKGPWKTQIRENDTVWIQSTSSDFDGVRNVAEINYRGINGVERLPNAHLIAAAPDMLEALEAIISFDDNLWDSLVNAGYHPDDVNKLADTITAAIAKAEGKGGPSETVKAYWRRQKTVKDIP